MPIEEARGDLSIIAVSVQIQLSRIKKIKRSRIFPNGTPIVHIYEAIRKTLAIIMAKNESISIASRENVILICPLREDIEYYEFSKSTEMIEAGYEASLILNKLT